MKLVKWAFALTLLVVVTGCAIGNKYDYRQTNISLPLTGSGVLGSGVIDMRSYVINGDKTPDFIGLQRGGFGNPFDVMTSSGKPLAEDMAVALTGALKNAGYNVNQLYFSSPDSSAVADVIAKDGMEKNVVLKVKEWKTDVLMNIKLSYDLLLQVLDRHGNVIASNASDGSEKLTGGGFESSNAQAAAAAFETKVGRLFNSPEIIAALKD